MTKNSTMNIGKDKFHVQQYGYHPNRWGVYRNGQSWATFSSHKSALTYATQQAHIQHLTDWQLIALFIEQNCYMVLINVHRQMLSVVAKANKPMMSAREAEEWIRVKPLPWKVKRTGCVVEFEPMVITSRIRAGVRTGEYYKYG